MALAYAPRAAAQQRTFHLDRLEVPGAPDDGLMLFRPVSSKGTRLYAQLGLGFSDSPLRTKNVTSDAGTLRRSNDSVINYQFTQYTSLGIQFMERFTVGLTFPVTWGQNGQNPNYGSTSISGAAATTTVETSGPAVADTRVDLRGTVLRSEDRRAALGAQFSLWLPTGSASKSNFGGDGSTSAMLMVSGEYRWRFLTFVGNLGLHFRPKNSINSPETGNGLGIGDEVRLALGAFVPFKQGKYRVGVTFMGQTGIQSDNNIIGNTAFTAQNTPIEWNVEGRMKFGPKNEWWTGLGIGSFIAQGYGAPDIRFVGLVGTSIPILDGKATSPDPREARRAEWRAARAKARDTDKDGIPDDEDACVEEAEDGKPPDPTDGCPAPPDTDGDGIPDMYDKCPDRAEDKDGIEDGDGCPEDDYDMDSVPDTEDACPKEPGKPSKDPKKNGCAQFIKFSDDKIMILEQVRFKTGSSQILPESFPMLQEIADVLKANQNVKRVSIEGHTDNRGPRDMNVKLSQTRADAVKTWLTQHGIAEDRLEAHGYGPDRPIDSNATEKGRTANRRVEFKVLEEADINKPNMPPPKPKPQKKEEPAEPSQDTDMEL